MTNPKPSRKRRRIALAVVVVFSLAGWLVAFPAYQRHRAVQEVERVGGYFGKETGTGPQWLSQFGIESDRLTIAYLGDSTISDGGLKRLSVLTTLEILLLDETTISDDGLKHLNGLTTLEVLTLSYTRISDDGLKHLSGLTNLQELNLEDTHVTEVGVKRLQDSLPKCRIHR